MIIDTNAIMSVTEANQNFSRATRMADAKGEVVLFKNNRPQISVGGYGRNFIFRHDG